MYVPLHNPVLAVVDQVDAVATRAVDPPGELASGWRDRFRQPSYYKDPVTGERKSAVVFVERRFEVQVEVDRDALKRMTATGDIPEFDCAFVAHMQDLENRGLMDSATGRPTVRVGDRVRRVVHLLRPTEVLESWPAGSAHELWIDEVRAASWGFGAGRDLFVFFCIKKEQPG